MWYCNRCKANTPQDCSCVTRPAPVQAPSDGQIYAMVSRRSNPAAYDATVDAMLVRLAAQPAGEKP